MSAERKGKDLLFEFSLSIPNSSFALLFCKFPNQLFFFFVLEFGSLTCFGEFGAKKIKERREESTQKGLDEGINYGKRFKFGRQRNTIRRTWGKIGGKNLKRRGNSAVQVGLEN